MVTGGKRNQNGFQEGKGQASILVGESYRDSKDPVNNTHIQRSWVYGKENSLIVAEKKLRNTMTSIGGGGTRNLSKLQKLLQSQKNNNRKIGDLHNSLPLESKTFYTLMETYLFFRRNEKFFPCLWSTWSTQKKENQNYKGY